MDAGKVLLWIFLITTVGSICLWLFFPIFWLIPTAIVSGWYLLILLITQFHVRPDNHQNAGEAEESLLAADRTGAAPDGRHITPSQWRLAKLVHTLRTRTRGASATTAPAEASSSQGSAEGDAEA